MSARAEQETTVTAGRDDDTVQVWTNNTVHLRRLRKDPRATEHKGDETSGHFTIPADMFDPLKGFRRARRQMTDDERAAASARLAAARADREDT
jgi:hypothetical protein